LGFLGDQTANLEKAQKNYPKIFQISSNKLDLCRSSGQTFVSYALDTSLWRAVGWTVGIMCALGVSPGRLARAKGSNGHATEAAVGVLLVTAW
jgi:hypothetical protein